MSTMSIGSIKNDVTKPFIVNNCKFHLRVHPSLASEVLDITGKVIFHFTEDGVACVGEVGSDDAIGVMWKNHEYWTWISFPNVTTEVKDYCKDLWGEQIYICAAYLLGRIVVNKPFASL